MILADTLAGEPLPVHSTIDTGLGCVTGSRSHDVIAKTKVRGEPTSARKNYMADLVIERLTGAPINGYVSAAMQWGIDQEPLARDTYALRCGDDEVIKPGYVKHPTIERMGCTPDGLVGIKGVVSFKCPLTATHLDALDGAPILAAYQTQMQHELACMPEREWVDYVSFDPRLPPRMRLYVVRVRRDQAFITMLENEIRIFLAELDERVASYRKRFGA